MREGELLDRAEMWLWGMWRESRRGVSLWHVKMCSTERGGSSRPQCGQGRGER